MLLNDIAKVQQKIESDILSDDFFQFRIVLPSSMCFIMPKSI